MEYLAVVALGGGWMSVDEVVVPKPLIVARAQAKQAPASANNAQTCTPAGHPKITKFEIEKVSEVPETISPAD